MLDYPPVMVRCRLVRQPMSVDHTAYVIVGYASSPSLERPYVGAIRHALALALSSVESTNPKLLRFTAFVFRISIVFLDFGLCACFLLP